MSDGSAWEREALSIKQVPSLQALLRCCDERLVFRQNPIRQIKRARGRNEPLRKGLHIRLTMKNGAQRHHGNTHLYVLKAIRCFDGDGFALFVIGHGHIEEAITART